MLFSGSPAQADVVVRAMKHVATAGGARPLSDADRTALVTAHAVVLRAGADLDPDALTDVEPEELARAITRREDAEHVVAFLAVMSVLDGQVDEARLHAANAYAAAVGIHPPYLRDLGRLALHRMAEAAADMGRRNVKSFTGHWLAEDIDTWLMPYVHSPDAELHARYAQLAGFPEGSFGRAFHEFYAANGFDYPGLPTTPNERFTTPHDSAHVLSGYDTSLQGEVLVSTFTAGMHTDEPVTGHILPVIVSWHLGIEVAKFAGAATGKLDPRKFWVAWERGDETTGDTLSPNWDFWATAEQPLAEVRRAMSVPDLEPSDAADGVYPDWYKPSA